MILVCLDRVPHILSYWMVGSEMDPERMESQDLASLDRDFSNLSAVIDGSI